MLRLLDEPSKYCEALEICNEALVIYPKDIAILLFRSYVLLKLKRYLESIENSERIIELDKTSAGAYYYKGCAKALLSEDSDALQLIKMAISLDKSCAKMAREDHDLVNLMKYEEFGELIK